MLIWTHPGSQGWRPVGGLVLHGGLLEVGIPHKFVYGAADDPAEIAKIASFCRAAHLKQWLNMSTIGTFGGRGMGQTCGAADPTQWMKMFGVDIDSRDTTELIRTAQNITPAELAALEPRIEQLFGTLPPATLVNERSMRLYLAIKKLVAEGRSGTSTRSSRSPAWATTTRRTCFAQSMMLEDGVGTSTLGDFNTALTVLLLTKLSTEPVYYGDLQHIDKQTRRDQDHRRRGLPAVAGRQAGPGRLRRARHPDRGRGGRAVGQAGLQGGRGRAGPAGPRRRRSSRWSSRAASIFEPPADQLEPGKLECGIPFWPHGFVTAHCDMDALLEHWTNEYACLGYGEHLYDDLVDFCEMTGIKAILP